MSVQSPVVDIDEIIYPESDGQPMADNSKQFRWIVTIKEGLDALLPDAFVAGDMLWYPVEGNNKIRIAPDVLVAFGRPKGDRGSYLQWRENNIVPQVVFEILSPGNTSAEMARKFEFYQRYGVDEYYVYDPDNNELAGWRRQGDSLGEIKEIVGWTSPWIGIRFEQQNEELLLIDPDGKPIYTYLELVEQQEVERQRAVEERRLRIQAEQQQEEERRQREQAEQQQEEERRRREQAEQRAQELAEKLQALGIDPGAE